MRGDGYSSFYAGNLDCVVSDGNNRVEREREQLQRELGFYGIKRTGFSWNWRDLAGEEKEREGEKRKNEKKSRSS